MSKALKAAIEANDPAAAKKALPSVKDLSRKLPKADAPVPYACKLGADQVLELLLDAGAPVSKKKQCEGEHPFALAAEHGHARIIAKLAARGIPHEVVSHTLFTVVLNGCAQAVLAILEHCHPPVPQRVLEISTWWKDGNIFNLLLQHGANVNVTNDGMANYDQLGQTPLHSAAGSGHLDPIRLLLDHGAEVNAADALGRTPLMHLAASMPRLDQNLRARQEAAKRVQTEAQKALQLKIISHGRPHGDRAPTDGMAAAQLLLERGADASRTDQFGNDALMYYEWQRRIDRVPLNGEFIALLEQAGATGGGVTADLFWSVRADDRETARQALAAGANVNQEAPPPVNCTPLLLARSPAMVELLLKSGADPNRPSLNNTPLISAAGSGELEIVKLLITAGADIHALQPRPPRSQYIANAWSAAELNRKYEVCEYLKSLGARQPVLPDWKPLEPGVGMWENFSEIIVKGPVPLVAAAIAQIIGGQVQENAYEKDFLPGKKSFVVLQPKGMAWSNLFQVAPPRRSFDTDTEFLRQLARATGAPVLLAQYSDAAGATSLEWFNPDGSSHTDDGWDRDTLQEVVGELGSKAPAWMQARLAEMEKSNEDEPNSEQRLEKLAHDEKFAIAWGGLQAEPGRKMTLSFTNLPAEAFKGVAWISQ